MLNENCKACTFFNDIGQLGQCRRFPVYQNRHHTEWCGEFSPSVVAVEILPVPEAGAFSPKKRGRPAKDAK
jgi:uncharacterized protein (UPF0179 family)